MRHILLTLAMSCALTASAAAQQLTLTFNDGLVTVDATAVPVRTILNEWAKRGDTKIVGVERISGAPLTVKLIDVPESQALEVILRSAAGYMAAPRSTGAGASIYDRILVMATSSTPAPSASRPPAPANPNAMTGTQRFVPPQRRANNDDNADAEEEDPNPPSPPVFTFPGAPNQNGQPGTIVNQPQGNVNGQPIQPMIVNPLPQTITVSPAPPGGYPTTVPFGSSTPGTISQPAGQAGQPGVPTRPPGRQQQ